MCDKTITGLVSHVDGDGPFLQVWFIKSLEDSKIQEERLQSLSVLLEGGIGIVDPNYLRIGQQIVVKRSDNKWYRAKIINLNSVNLDNFIEIYYIDNGQSDFVCLTEVRTLEPIKENNIYDFPPLASNIYLYGVISSDKKQFWSSQTLDTINQNICYRDAEFECKFVFPGNIIFMSVKYDGDTDLATMLLQSKQHEGEEISMLHQQDLAADYFKAKDDMIYQKSLDNSKKLREKMESSDMERRSHVLQGIMNKMLYVHISQSH
jgi:hypothetical protein